MIVQHIERPQKCGETVARSSTSGQGRRKGVKNKKTLELRKAVSKGLTPLQHMLRVMRSRSKKVDDARRDDMAKAAAPYVHPRLTAVEATGKDGTPLIPPPTDPIETARRVAFLLNSANQKAQSPENPI